MSVSEPFPEMDDTDFLGLFLDADHGQPDPFCGEGNSYIEDWLFGQDVLNSQDTEDFLNSLLDEGPIQSFSPPGSDSGISDMSNPQCQSPRNSDSEPAPCHSPGLLGSTPLPEVEVNPVPMDAIQVDHCYSLQRGQLADDTLLSVRSEQPDTDVFIDLDSAGTWDSDSVVEMCSDDLPCTLAIEDLAPCTKANEFQEIVLTAEEKRLLVKEGVTIPTHMPLTKAEERSLKRIRRKIRNKQSAQESRKKKKVYVDGLENRVAVCTAQNQELQKKVQILQKQNMSLIEQVKKLQSLIKLSTMKSSTTGTCLMVFLLSFCLIIFPSVNPFGSSTIQKDLYAPSGVLSRTIRSIPVDESSSLPPVEFEGEEELLIAEVVQGTFSSGQNHTPDYQRVEQSESESGVNSNSSSDFPTPPKSDVRLPASMPESPLNSAVPPIDYHASGSDRTWMEQKSITVTIQKHRSDEM